MKKYILIITSLMVVLACQNNYQLNDEKEIGHNIDTSSTITDTLITKTDSISLDSVLSPPPNNINPPDYAKIKFPVLMVVANGCSGVTTYKYKIPNRLDLKHEIEIIKENPDCPDYPNYKSPKGTYFARIHNKFSVCKTNYIIKIMTAVVPDYLEKYNKYFKTNFKIETPPPYQVDFPKILFQDEGDGGSTEIVYVQKNNSIQRGGCVHDHSFTFNPNDCRAGIYLAELPATLADSTIQLIIDKTISYYPNYKELYQKTYGDFPFKNSNN